MKYSHDFTTSRLHDFTTSRLHDFTTSRLHDFTTSRSYAKNRAIGGPASRVTQWGSRRQSSIFRRYLGLAGLWSG
ncbi:MAG: hypothetical protein SWC40_11955, partial [Thermodesulfobacteriota bacterium]|nr:hypothetical protein [Thermodesulfobacteriota bacterium]